MVEKKKREKRGSIGSLLSTNNVMKKCINCGKEFNNNYWVLTNKQNGAKKYLCDTELCLREIEGETCLKNYDLICLYIDKKGKEWEFKNQCARHYELSDTVNIIVSKIKQ